MITLIMKKMKKCMSMTSPARNADIIAAGAKKDRGDASSIQETIMSVFLNLTGAISGRG